MKPAPLEYLAADSIDQAVDVLASYGDEAKVVAGGQSLVPMLNMRLAQPELLVDIGRLDELRAVTPVSGSVRYGAATTHSRFEDRAVPDAGGGLMAAAAGGIGYRAVRNRGTIAGSLAHADASAEWPVVLAALGATIHTRSVRGTRELPAAGFLQGFFTSVLAGDEIIVAVEVPVLGPDATWGFLKFARKDGEFAESLAVAVLRWAGGRVAHAELWLGAAREIPLAVVLPEGEIGGTGAVVARDRLATAVRDVVGAARTAEERYRLNLHVTTLSRALRQAVQRRSAHDAAV
ncbi:MAG: FAD binding domain-containing protein [Streptosporangiaceae bacterium]